MFEKRTAVERTVLLYVIIASLWVFLAEQVPAYLTGNSTLLTFLQVYRGTGYVVFSGILIYVLLLVGSPMPLFKMSKRYPLSHGTAETKNGAKPVPPSDFDALIERWAQALELRSRETEDHRRQITGMAVQLGKLFNLPDEELLHIRRGAYLHDIGKMALPDSILLKNGPLTEEERATMQRHPSVALQLLSGIPSLEPALDIPCSHHEKWDGSGYPRGLKGDEIPLAARIFAVIDVWDALTSERPYRNALPERAALTYIRSQSGVHFDPQVVERFLQLSRIAEVRYKDPDDQEARGEMESPRI